MKTTKTVSLESIVTFKSGCTPSKSVASYWGGDIPWVSAKDIKSFIVNNSIDRLTSDGFSVAKIAPKDSLLILVRGMTLHNDIPICLAGRDIAFNQDIKALICGNEVIPEYLLYYLISQKQKIRKLIDSSGHGTGRLDTNLLRKFSIIIPSLDAQKNVSDCLRNWDIAIKKTNRLIEAKERQLKWLRNYVLTGKKRVDGYSNPWTRVNLRDVLFEHKQLSSGREEVYSISVHKGVINQVEHLGRVFAADNTSNYNLVKPGDVVYTKSPTGDFPFGIIKQSKLPNSVIVSPLYGVFTPISFDLGVILDCYFESDINTKNYLRPLIQKGAKNTINITNQTFLQGSLLLPMDHEEQKAIAEIITLAQQEISSLKIKNQFFIKQKQGLMQKLLTGKWQIYERG